jgi:NAD(P)-dependent dehydrogenase (short-subunit alcohol dehydrogenase family)
VKLRDEPSMTSMSLGIPFIVLLVSFGVVIAWLIKRFTLDKAQVPDISRRYVLVTGCGSGFGKLAVERLDRHGFRVFATCRTKSSEEEIRRICSERVKTFCMDVTSTQDLERVYRQVRDEIPCDQGKDVIKYCLFGLTWVINSGSKQKQRACALHASCFFSILINNQSLWGLLFY